MIPTKQVGGILREAWGQTLGVGKDSSMTRCIQTAGINCRSGVPEERMSFF